MSDGTMTYTLDELLSTDAPQPNGLPDLTLADRQQAQRLARIAMGQAMIDGKTPDECKAAGMMRYLEACKHAVGLYGAQVTPDLPEDPMPILDMIDSGWPNGAPAIEVPAVVTIEPVIGEGEYDAAADQRIAEDREYAAIAGILTKEPIYRQGSRVNSTGVENARLKRQQFEDMAEIDALCTTMQTRVTNEERYDVVVPLTSLQMASHGPLIIPGEDSALNLSEVAFKGLLGRVVGGSGYHYLADKCDSRLRALNVNGQIGYIAEEEVNTPIEEHRKAKLRIRTHEAGKHVFAVVGASYAKHDVDEIAGVISQATTGLGMRGELVYDGFQMRMNAFGHSTVAPEHYAAGEVFRVGVQVSAKDDGTGAIRVNVLLFQNLCLNLIILHETSKSVGVFRHRGKPEELAAKVRKAITDAVGMVKPFLARWTKAQNTNALERSQSAGFGGKEIGDVFRGILIDKLVTVPTSKGFDREKVVERLVSAHAKDTSSAIAISASSIAAIVNAFTRIAHEDIREMFPEDPWAEDGIQQSASGLLYRAGALPSYTEEEAILMDGRRKSASEEVPSSG